MFDLSLLKIIAIAGLIGIFVFYVMSVYTDSPKDGLTNQMGRWLYLVCWVVFISSVLIYVLSVFIPQYVNLVVVLSVIGFTSLLFKDMFVSVSTNEVWIVQNTWITRTYEHRSMRLQLRGGINILLHGEEVKGKITDELYVYDLEVKNIECKSGVPMLAKLAYQISPDFSNFQALTRLDEDEKQGIGKAKKVFDAAIVNLISIVFSEKEQNEIKKKRVEINNDIKDLIFNQGLLRDQEDHTGCKIVSLMISDTDDTEEIRKSNEQLYVSRGQGEAVKKLMETMGVSIDDKRMSTAEKNAIIERMHAAVMANSGKSQRKDNHIHVGGTSLDRTTMGRIIGETVESSK